MVPIQLLHGQLPALGHQIEDSDEARVADSDDGDSRHLDVLVGAVIHPYPGTVVQPDTLKEDLERFESR